VTIEDLKAAPIDVVLTEAIKANEDRTPEVAAANILAALAALGWKITRK
jgi:hypothetical protein